jgi:hypothetical protein
MVLRKIQPMNVIRLHAKRRRYFNNLYYLRAESVATDSDINATNDVLTALFASLYAALTEQYRSSTSSPCWLALNFHKISERIEEAHVLCNNCHRCRFTAGNDESVASIEIFFGPNQPWIEARKWGLVFVRDLEDRDCIV